MADRNQTRKKLQVAAKKRRRAPKGAAHAGEFVTSGASKLHNIFMQTAGAVQGHKVVHGGYGPNDEGEPPMANLGEQMRIPGTEVPIKPKKPKKAAKPGQMKLPGAEDPRSGKKSRKVMTEKGKRERQRAAQKIDEGKPGKLEGTKKQRRAAAQKVSGPLAEAKQQKDKIAKLEEEVREARRESVFPSSGPQDEPVDRDVKITEGSSEEKDESGIDESNPNYKPKVDKRSPDTPHQRALLESRKAMDQGHPRDSAIEIGLAKAGPLADPAWVRKQLASEPKTTQTMPRISSSGSMDQRTIDDQTGDWWNRPESPDGQRSKTGVKPDSSRRKRGKPSEQKAQMSPAERDWLDEQAQTEGSPYYQSTGKEGQQRTKANLRIYAALREEGYSPKEAHKEVTNPQRRQGQGRVSATRPKGEAEQEAQKRVQETVKPKSAGTKDKYAKAGGKHEDFAASVKVPGVDIEEIKKEFPDWSDQDLVKYSQQHKESVNDWLEKNERWAHEQRVANMLGRKDTGENKDRVVFFTTNAGSPTASVPSNSLIGQYIIKKRKKMVVDERNAVRSEVKGEFPRAVRDQHLIEVSTGVSLGAQGRYGAFHTTGWKAGKKRSKGYGKQVPVGTQILRDKNNQPVYDKNGNLRYTEGYTRPFTLTTDRDVGLRVFLG